MRKFEGFMKGVNLGGWISQYDKYDKAHFESFITEKDLDYIKSLKFDHVRVPVDYNVLEDEEGNIKEEGFGYLSNCLKWCEERDLNLLIDLHECFGYSFDPLKDMDRSKFFYDEALQNRFLKLWREIAERFGSYPDRVAFEPLNEVVLESVADAWNKVLKRYIEEMRAITKDTYIICGGVMYNNVRTVPLIDIPLDDKIIYNFHCYDPFLFTHQGAYWVEDFEEIFAPALQKAEKDNVPLYCGEYGVIDLADNHEKIKWLKDIHCAFEKHGIGHALWNYKEKDFGLVDESFEEIREDFIKIL